MYVFMVYGLRMGSMGVRCAALSGGLQQSLHMLHHWTHLSVTPLTHSPDLETGAISRIMSPGGHTTSYTGHTRVRLHVIHG